MSSGNYKLDSSNITPFPSGLKDGESVFVNGEEYVVRRSEGATYVELILKSMMPVPIEELARELRVATPNPVWVGNRHQRRAARHRRA